MNMEKQTSATNYLFITVAYLLVVAFSRLDEK
jgi:hypothetical protein